MIHGPSFIMLHVQNIPAARQFCTDMLGYDVEAEAPGFVQFVNTGGATLALGEAGAGDPIELWWFVDDADGTYSDLQSRGAEVVGPPADMPFGRVFSIKDPSGGTVNFLQPAEGA
jgi:predicted enzyme related to lactoylglutathione lyase